jgi:hypothetical protein
MIDESEYRIRKEFDKFLKLKKNNKRIKKERIRI